MIFSVLTGLTFNMSVIDRLAYLYQNNLSVLFYKKQDII